MTWPKQRPPVAGRQGEQTLRKMLASIGRAMSSSEATPRELLQLLRHQQRLADELKEVVERKIRAKLAEIDRASTSQSEQVGQRTRKE